MTFSLTSQTMLRFARCLTVGSCLWTLTVGAHAAPESTTPPVDSLSIEATKERRDWMNKGNAEYVQKHWEAARDNYLKAWAIKHHFTIAANIADVEIKMGHYAEAVGYLKYVLANIPEEQVEKRRFAEEQLLECRNHLTAVRVTVDVPDATIMVDGRDVGQTPLRDDLLLEPGQHVISVTKPGYGNQSKELSAEGSQVQVTLTLEKLVTAQPVVPTVAPVAAHPRATDSTHTSHSSGLRLGSYAAFGVGAVGLGLGTYFLISAHGNTSAANREYSACDPGCPADQQRQIDDLDVSGAHQRTAGAIAFAVGGAGVLTGIALLLFDHERPSSNAAHARPWIGLGQAGLSGQF